MGVVSIVKSETSDGHPEGKRSHKLSPEAVKAILDLTVAGFGNRAIQTYIRDKFGVTIHANLIGYYRKKHAEELRRRYRDEVIDARIACPELATLAGRIGLVDTLIKKEMAKGEKCSANVVVSAVHAAGTMMFRAEQLAMGERKATQKSREEDSREVLLQELERRSHVANMK